MGQIYLKSPGGLVMDMDERKAAKWLKAGWVKINATEFKAGLKAHQAKADEKREEIKQELADQG